MDIHRINSLSHIMFNGPLMIYIGVTHPKNIIFYWLLLIIGIIIIALFCYKALTNQLYAFLIVHLVLFSALFLSIAYLRFTNQTIPYYLYNFLIAIGIAAIGYHTMKLLNLTNHGKN